MYLYRFSMKKLPFVLTPDTEFFCALPTHIEALNVLNFALNTGEALIKIIGQNRCVMVIPNYCSEL